MRIFISGGCKNGKSTLAQVLAVRQQTGCAQLYYVATMRPADSEDEARVARHVAERAGMGFTTVEQPENIAALSKLCDTSGSFLLDSLTALLSNEMFPPHAAQPDFGAPARVQAQLCGLLTAVKNIVIVSDFIYSDALLYDETVEVYRKGLAQLDKTAAALCDTVLEVCAATVTVHRGRLPVGAPGRAAFSNISSALGISNTVCAGGSAKACGAANGGVAACNRAKDAAHTTNTARAEKGQAR